jgi:putative endonuclease
MTPEKARASRALGQDAEAAVEQYFLQQGFGVLSRNHHSREGELDLVVRKSDLVIFVEVKARKQRKIVRAAFDFVQRHGLEQLEMRFDVVAVTPGGRGAAPFTIEQFEAAFDSSVADESAVGR